MACRRGPKTSSSFWRKPESNVRRARFAGTVLIGCWVKPGMTDEIWVKFVVPAAYRRVPPSHREGTTAWMQEVEQRLEQLPRMGS